MQLFKISVSRRIVPNVTSWIKLTAHTYTTVHKRCSFTPVRHFHNTITLSQDAAMPPGWQNTGRPHSSDSEDFDDVEFMRLVAERNHHGSNSNHNNEGISNAITVDYSDSISSQEISELCKVSERWAAQQLQLREDPPEDKSIDVKQNARDISSSPPMYQHKRSSDESIMIESDAPSKMSRVDSHHPPPPPGSEFVVVDDSSSEQKAVKQDSHPPLRSSDPYSWPPSPSYEVKPTRNVNLLPAHIEEEGDGGDSDTSSTQSDEPDSSKQAREKISGGEDYIALPELDDSEEAFLRKNPKRQCNIEKTNYDREQEDEDEENSYNSDTVQKITEKVGDVPAPFLSFEQREVLKKVLQGHSVFFTGSAGTGKSVLLREIIKALRNRHKKPNYFKNIPGMAAGADDNNSVAVTASTGLAACNIGGTTLHSFAGIGLGKEDADKLVRKIRRNRKCLRRWKSVKVLVVDELSMVDGELFDKLEYVARKIRRSEKPFGGVQLVLTGDFFQLPPVPDPDKQAKFAFEGETWGITIAETCQLCKVFRQKDNVFSNMLNEMRIGKMDSETIRTFKSHYAPLTSTGEIEATELFPRKADVERANNKRLEALEGDKVVYDAVDSYTDEALRDRKILDNMMAPKRLIIKEGAQVMSIKNIDETLVNGSVGTVVGFMDEGTYQMLKDDDGDSDTGEETIFGKRPTTFRSVEESFIRKLTQLDDLKSKATHKSTKYPLVRFQYPDGTFREVLLSPEKWSIEDYEGKTLASRHQVPLILAWALSIHKAQGQTLQYVKVNLNNAFERGQAYVALSRATSLDGLQVLGFHENKVMVHPKVVSFYESLKRYTDD